MNNQTIQQKLQTSGAAVIAAKNVRVGIAHRQAAHARATDQKSVRLTALETALREQRTAAALGEQIQTEQIDLTELETLRADIAVAEQVTEVLKQRSLAADQALAEAKAAHNGIKQDFLKREAVEPARVRLQCLLEELHDASVDLMAANYAAYFKFDDRKYRGSDDLFGPADDLLKGLASLRWYATPYRIEPNWLRDYRSNRLPAGYSEKLERLLAKVEEDAR